MNEDTRRNVDRIYNFKTGCVKPECLHEGWQTSGSAKVVRMAFNRIAMVHRAWMMNRTQRSRWMSAGIFSRGFVLLLLCTIFLAGNKIRYPEYATYNKNLYAMFGGND